FFFAAALGEACAALRFAATLIDVTLAGGRAERVDLAAGPAACLWTGAGRLAPLGPSSRFARLACGFTSPRAPLGPSSGFARLACGFTSPRAPLGPSSGFARLACGFTSPSRGVALAGAAGA